MLTKVKDKVTNEHVYRKIQAANGEYEALLAVIKQREKAGGLYKSQGLPAAEEKGSHYQKVDRDGL